MASAAHDYRSIRGSAALGTAPIAAVPAVAQAEALEPGEMRRIAFGDELLGAARVRSHFAALPFEAFDRAGEVLTADEQGAYFQLLRLAYGEGRNFCRTAKKDLLRRLRLSERRLHRVLDALVAKRFVRPLHRDNHGTLWRVYLPAEAFGEPVGDDVLLGRPAQACSRPEPEEERPRPTVRATANLLSARRSVDRAVLVHDLAVARGHPEDLTAAAEELAALAADGATPRQIEACVRAVSRRANSAGVALERGTGT